MRRTQHILFGSLLGFAWAAPVFAQTTTPLDARAVRPAVMLLVDTSGSMERLPDDGTNTACDDCLPTCTGNSAQDSSQKNRWAVTVEALTGTFQNYSCQAVDRSTYPVGDYDYGYYLPHIDFTASPSQNTDGILDSFVNRVKFGLMTFDGVGTTIGGETLIAWSRWQGADAPFLDQANGGPGMYSYGEPGRLSFPGCPTDYGVNAGARGPGNHPGALISVGSSDNADDVRLVNQRIQSSLLEVRPFGGTPIAAMLDDLAYYVTEDPAINVTSDPLYQCRKRVGILITDGAPDALFRDARFQCDSTVANNCASDTTPGNTDTSAKCQCPYKTAEELAGNLIKSPENLLDQLVVVAYNVHEPAALATLNGIAQRGWPAGRVPAGTTPEYPYLITADGPNQLRDRLDTLLDGNQPGVTSRSVPVALSTGRGALSADNKSFEITAGFQLGRNSDEAWSGLLYRRRITCDGTDVESDNLLDPSEGDVFHVSLDNQSASSRNLFSYVPTTPLTINGSLRNGTYRPEVVQGTDSGYSSVPLNALASTMNKRKPSGQTFGILEGALPDDTTTLTQGLSSSIVTRQAFDNGLSPSFFGDANGNHIPGEGPDRAAIVQYVRGESASRPLAMGDIYHSNPVAVPPLRASNLQIDELSTDYTHWQEALVATGGPSQYGSDGRPGVVYVGTNDGILHAFNLDLWQSKQGDSVAGGQELWGFIPPALFGKMAAMVAPAHQFMFDGTPVVKDVVLQQSDNTPAIFRTILVSAIRGAPAFVALDVTFPESPVFLWQVSFPDVGETIGTPALTQVTIDWNGVTQQRAVAILPGGAGEQQGLCPSTGQTLDVDHKPSDPFDARDSVRCWKRRGRALYVVDVATGALLQEFGTEHFSSPLTGSVVTDSDGIGASSAAYVFDHDGLLWRLSMLGTEPSDWRVAPIFDMFADPAIAPATLPQRPLEDWQAGRVPQYTPALTRDKQGNLVIVAGTGDIDNISDTALQRVVSLTEKRADYGGQIGGTVKLNWKIDLERNETVTGPLTIFENNVYFATFMRSVGDSECSLGASRIYGAHAYTPNDVTTTEPMPKLPPKDALPGDTTLVLKEMVGDTSTQSNLLLGLTVERQPICLDDPLLNLVTGQTMSRTAPGGGMYQLTGLMGGASTAGQSRGGSSIVQMPPRNLSTNRPSSVSAWVGAVE